MFVTLFDSVLDSEIYPFIGLCSFSSFCGLTVLEQSDKIVLVLSENPDNSGTSVTIAVAHLATELYLSRFSHVPVSDFFVIEHYGKFSYEGSITSSFFQESDTFDFVTFKWTGTEFVDPEWKHINSDNYKIFMPFLNN